MLSRLIAWLRSLRRCVCCGKRSYSSTPGEAWCAFCDGHPWGPHPNGRPMKGAIVCAPVGRVLLP